METKEIYTPVQKAGRSYNGFHKDRGTVVHLIVGDEPNGYWDGKSLCGVEPGLRSTGWSKAIRFVSREEQHPSEVTCQKCLNKIKTK